MSAHDPEHYKGEIECIDAIRASMTPGAYRGYLKGNVMKYLWRYEKKGGVQDLEKARVYLNWLIDDILPATIEGVTTRKDRTWKVTLGTQELPVDKAAALLTLNHQLAYVAIKPEYFSSEEEQLLDQLKADPEAGGKTPGSRLRAVLYRNYEQNDQGFGSFASYYEHHMERLIEHFKGKLT